MWFSSKVNCILSSITKNAVSSFRGITLPTLVWHFWECIWSAMSGFGLPVSRKTLAYPSESNRGWARCPRSWMTWWMRAGWGNEVCFALTREVSRESLLLPATTWMDGARLLPEACSYGMWGNGHKLDMDKLDIGKTGFTMKFFKSWNQLLLEFLACPSLEVSETWLDTAVCNLL